MAHLAELLFLLMLLIEEFNEEANLGRQLLRVVLANKALSDNYLIMYKSIFLVLKVLALSFAPTIRSR